MKEHRIIKAMVILLAISILHLGMTKFRVEDIKEIEESEQVIKVMSEIENKLAFEAYLKKLSIDNETKSCNTDYLKTDNDQELLDELTHDSLDEYYNGIKETSKEHGNMTNEDMLDNPSAQSLPDYASKYPDMYVEHYVPQNTDKQRKVAYLTFDDGPSVNTKKILDILEQKNAVATFFILGSTMTDEGKADLQRMVDMGCGIGLHTYSHEKNIIYRSVDSFLSDINEVYQQVYEITGQKPCIYRFPWGSYNRFSKGIKKEVVCEMERRGFTYFDWNVSAEDSVGKPSTYSIQKNILKDVKRYNQPVILMHDSMINTITVNTLPSIIDELRSMGYEFDTLLNREPCQFCW